MLLLIAATMTVAGLLTAGANSAGAIYDKAIIDDSLNNMQETVSTLQDKAEKQTNQIKKQEMILKAQSLNETEQKLRDLGEKFYKNDLKSEAAGLSRSLIVPIKTGGIKEVSEMVKKAPDALTVVDTSIQTFNNIANAETNPNPADDRSMLWSKITDNSDECEIQVLIAKARQLTKEAKKVKEEATQMADYYRQEEQRKLTSRQVEDKLAEVVESSPELQEEIKKDIWDYMDFAESGNKNNSENKTASNISKKTREEEKEEVEIPLEDKNKTVSKSKKYSQKELEQLVINNFSKVFKEYIAVEYKDVGAWLMNKQGDNSCRWSGISKCDHEGIRFTVRESESSYFNREDFDDYVYSEKEEAEYELDSETGYDMRHKNSTYGASYYGDTTILVEKAPGYNDEHYMNTLEYYCYPYILTFEGYSKDKETVNLQNVIFKEIFDTIGNCK